MTQPIIILCGVPGSGKTWVIDRLGAAWSHISHDLHYRSTKEQLAFLCVAEAKAGNRPVIVDCPFAERVLRDTIRAYGIEPEAVFIVETPDVVNERYRTRGKETPKATLTRARTIEDRAIEWNAFHGTSSAVLEYLQTKEFACSQVISSSSSVTSTSQPDCKP